MADPGLDAIVARLRLLEDQEAIRRLKADYCLHADIGNPDPKRGLKLGALFTADAVWDVGVRRCVGPQEIAKALMSLPEAWSIELSVHFTGNPRIDIDGDRATGMWTFLIPARFKGAATPDWFAGAYHESYVRAPDGWRFSDMRSAPVLVPGTGE